jgi:hypothetical protein
MFAESVYVSLASSVTVGAVTSRTSKATSVVALRLPLASSA